MERFVKDPHTLRQESQGSLCPHIDEFAQHRKSLVAPVTPVERTTIDKLLDDFSLYLQQERVLAATTVANYVSLIKKFLTHRFGTGPADLFDLTAAQVVGSVQRLVPSLCRKRAKVMTSALRSFLRYARYQDFIRSDLAACVPCVADWSVASKRLADRACQTSAGQLQSEERYRPTRLRDPVAVVTSWAASRRSGSPHVGGLRLGNRAAHLARQR